MPLKKFKFSPKPKTKPPMSAYSLFMEEKRPGVKKRNPHWKVEEVAFAWVEEELQRMWENITVDEKERFEKKAAKLKEEFEKMMAK